MLPFVTPFRAFATDSGVADVPPAASSLRPKAPVTGSPVPRLTSLYHFDSAIGYGNRGYAGNCGGGLIKDLLQYFRPENVFDPMAGSGTCADVCRELDVPLVSRDIHGSFDAADPGHFRDMPQFEFI